MYSTLNLSTDTPHIWKLTKKFTYTNKNHWSQNILLWQNLGIQIYPINDNDITIIIPPGTVTDLGSSPRILWFFCSPVDIAMASVIHDAMYLSVTKAYINNLMPFSQLIKLRNEADNLFFECIISQPSSLYLRAWFAWLAVRVFGWIYAYGILTTMV